ncbi:MAG: hypothetical protein H6Q48_478 [Deltaproteobacteria bacterium]|nr:hypothetical protein [Deltaproteobacteria bacterium]
MTACARETDLDKFSQMVTSFYLDTEPDGFDAFYELEQVYRQGCSKWEVIQSVRKILESDSEPQDIDF